MGKMFVVARRELDAYFLSPIAYVVGAVFLFASGLWFFYDIFVPGNEASLRPLFDAMAYMMVFAIPLLTMRLLSEEFRSGTIESLLTAPITDTQVVLGKYLGVMGFYLVLLAETVVFLVLMILFGQPDAGVAAMGYLGMLLLGSAYAAVGIFASSLTGYQLLAALLGSGILAVFAMLTRLLVTWAPEPWNYLAAKLNAMTYFYDFSRGMFDTRGLVFFLSMTVLFLFFTVKTLESRRWR